MTTAAPSSSIASPASTGAEQAPLIRRARQGDVPAIVGLIIAGDIAGNCVDSLDEAVLPAYVAAFANIDANPAERLFVVEWQGSVVGTFQISFCQTLAQRGRLRAVLESVHVAPQMRGKRIGAAMVAHAIAVAREVGAGVMQLTSNKLRTEAHRFYERLGFKRSHEGFKLEI